ncbi:MULTISPECIES: hypothetical protein [Mesonia]|uniref:Uncharacterized protein n=1 Tax=Mesonia oceanica TaxID=2687242 RepID=A0AC61YDP9_9FLAO|nr:MULTISPECIES: hypothetical protein [Mesonia]MBJ98762.1 hypothetical protein [Flavobacteriaceae bacterium]MAN29149.1 hypothetical protein [Mesonia sp.]MAQ39638.1 hypothetical protein [Mesonia sp.]MAQ42830.1 hypothetical protein [Mesonia sp.]VVV02529.1 hypothetical protein FVB9532_03829 [Mesonia oceanica]|tara:strand:+ start:956 stop:1198 length:243 start_codon:yes stop_codon:yes gene_type:complete
MKYVIIVLFIAIAIATGVGLYIITFEENESLGNIIMGITVLASSFILMPLFIYHRWKGKKLEDYTLSRKNLDKMRDQDII